MSHRKIVVCMGSEAQARRVCRIACDMARGSHAHLVGVNTACHPGNPATAAGSMYMMPANPSEMLETDLQSESALMERSFRATVNDEVANCEWANVDDTSDDAAECLARVAHHADLVIMAQGDPACDTRRQIDLLHEFAEHARCPVLIVPAGSDNDVAGTPALASLGVLSGA